MSRWLLMALLVLVAPRAWPYDYATSFDPGDPDTWPVVAIIIDDIGNRQAEGQRAVNLPGPVALAVLPHTPFGSELAVSGHKSGKEIMLHQPLQATENNHLLGAGAITLDQSYDEVRRTLKANLEGVPHVVGVNNHMGSLLTRHPGHMRWLMSVLQEEGELFFVDSATTASSVALSIAGDFGLPRSRRNVFLDSEQSFEAVAHQFQRLKQHAREHGYAVAIGHPFAATLDVLEQELPRLAGLGYRLVGIQSMIELQSRQRDTNPAPGSLPVQVLQDSVEYQNEPCRSGPVCEARIE